MDNSFFQFLGRLAANNNRPWFQGHKAEFDIIREQWYAEVDRVIAAMTPAIPELAGQSGRTASYRIYRDTRFSLDKTPYKTYFSALISPHGRTTNRAGFYIHAGIDGSGLYGGIWCPPSPVLRKLRHAIVDNIEEFEQIINEKELLKLFPGWTGDKLKTIPKGWGRDHPQAELLRLKELGKVCPIDNDFFNHELWPEIAAKRLLVLKPLVDFINYTIDEE